eukprot:gene5478-6029_t
MYIRKERKKPFTPSASFQSLSKSLLSSASPPTTTTSLTDSISTNGRRESTILKEEIKDAETGESLSFTKAKWTAKEGRLSLNAKVILAMGTGKLDIITSSQHSDRGVKINETHEQERCPTATAHPLIQEFLTKGPLTPYMHKNWDPRRDRVRSSKEMEKNKVLTKEEPRPGGKKAVRTLCWQLAKLKVKQRQELAKALEDEQDRESKRLQAERENWDNANVLRELRKANRAARKKGQIYLEHLQRDQEVIFMRKMKDFELLCTNNQYLADAAQWNNTYQSINRDSQSVSLVLIRLTLLGLQDKVMFIQGP